jgi:hypothetical protein
MLDEHDNLRSSLKWVVDSIAGLLLPNLAEGRADDDKRISWSYNQERRGIREYGLKVLIIEDDAMIYRADQTCRFCLDPESILTQETCCTGCSRLKNDSELGKDEKD